MHEQGASTSAAMLRLENCATASKEAIVNVEHVASHGDKDVLNIDDVATEEEELEPPNRTKKRRQTKKRPLE